MPTIHDCGYKKLFSNKAIFRQLIEMFVTEDWVAELDFDSCVAVDKSFISEHYKETESDIIYKLKLKDQELYIFILIEFQSTVDRFMALRMLNYITNFYMDYVSSQKRVQRLPAVFPILLYNGEAQWNAPINLAERIEGGDRLGRFGLNFEYFKIAENSYSKDELLRIRNIVSTLFLAESYYDIELLGQELLTLFEREPDREAVSLFLNWFKHLSEHGRIEKEDYETLEKVYTTREEVQSMLIKALQREKKEIFQKGKREGRIEGKLEGKLEAKIEAAKNLLAEGLSIEFIARVTGLPEAEILKIQSCKN